MRVLFIAPGERPKELIIDGNLDELQALVGGYIETYRIGTLMSDNVAIICNEDGKIQGLPICRSVWENGNPCELLVGNILIVGTDNRNEDFCSLNDEQVEKYMHLFWRGKVEL